MVNRIIAGVYAVTGTGKTALALTADNVLLVDFDCGAHRVPLKLRTGKEGLSDDKVVFPINKYEDFVKFKQDLAGGIKFARFKTIAIDTINKLQTLVSEKVISDYNKKFPNKPARTLGDVGGFGKGQGEVNEECRRLVVSLIGSNKNVIFLSQAKEIEKKDIKDRNQTYSALLPDMSDSSYKVFFDSCDFVASVSKNSKGERVINLTSPEATTIKGESSFYNQDGILEDIVLPNVSKNLSDVSSVAPKFFQEKIIDVFLAGFASEQQLIDDAMEQFLSFENNLNTCETQNDIDNIYIACKSTTDRNAWLLANKQSVGRKMADIIKAKGFKKPEESLAEKVKTQEALESTKKTSDLIGDSIKTEGEVSIVN
jgi:hypothetical protein